MHATAALQLFFLSALAQQLLTVYFTLVDISCTGKHADMHSHAVAARLLLLLAHGSHAQMLIAALLGCCVAVYAAVCVVRSYNAH